MTNSNGLAPDQILSALKAGHTLCPASSDTPISCARCGKTGTELLVECRKPEPKRDQSLRIRLSLGEKLYIEEQAEANGISVSEYIRKHTIASHVR